MKTYTERLIRRSELFQLIILQSIYTRPESSRLIFQGGTALRWCYNSGRFSEDLDFVTHLERPALERLLKGVEAAVARESIAHFGPGRLAITSRGQRDKGWSGVSPLNRRTCGRGSWSRWSANGCGRGWRWRPSPACWGCRRRDRI